jgi:hypothetical protein
MERQDNAARRLSFCAITTVTPAGAGTHGPLGLPTSHNVSLAQQAVANSRADPKNFAPQPGPLGLDCGAKVSVDSQ